jgi:hypothetical protein
MGDEYSRHGIRAAGFPSINIILNGDLNDYELFTSKFCSFPESMRTISESTLSMLSQNRYSRYERKEQNIKKRYFMTSLR